MADLKISPLVSEEATKTENIDGYAEIETETKMHHRTFIAIASICFLAFAQMITIVGSGFLAQQTATYFGDRTKSVWFSSILTIYGLALMPLVGQVADYFGRKWPMVIVSAMGVVGPITISRAQNMNTVIAGFNLLGPAMSTQALTFAIVSEIVARRYRGMTQAALSMSTGTGAIVATLMGGALLRHNDAANYRIYWYVAAALYAVGTLGIAFGYRPPLRELQTSLSTLEKLKKLDFIALFLIASGLALFSMGLQWYGNPYEFDDVHVLAPFLIGILLVIGFGVHSWRKRDGFLHHDLFGHRNFPLAIFMMFLEGLFFFAVNAYNSYEWSVLYQLDLLESGYRFALLFLASIVIAPVAGAYITRKGRVLEPLISGFAVFTTGFALLASISYGTPSWVSWVYSVINGVALGLVLPTLYVTTQMATPASMIAVTTSLISAVRSLGGAVGLAVNNALFTKTLNTKLPDKVANAVLPLGFSPDHLGSLISAVVSGNANAMAAVPGATQQIIASAGRAVRQAYIESFRNAWISAGAFSAAGLVASLFILNNRSVFNKQVDAPVEVKSKSYAREA